jgi:hypothetical protein
MPTFPAPPALSRSRSGRRGAPWHICRILATLLLLVVSHPAAAAPPPAKHILIVRAEAPSLPGGRVAADAIEKTVRSSVAAPIEFYVESVDTTRFTSEQYERRLADLFAEKYTSRRLDLIVALGEPAVDFVLRQREIFPGTPLLLGMIERRSLAAAMFPRETGVVYVQLGPVETLRLAFQLVPSARKAVVVGGTSRADRGWMRLVREDLGAVDLPAPIEYDTESSLDVLAGKVRTLPADTIVIYASVSRDGDGAPSHAVGALEQLRAAAAVPIFGLSTSYMGHGIVGGHLLDFDRHGADLGRQAVRLLAGERPAKLTGGRPTDCRQGRRVSPGRGAWTAMATRRTCR